MVYKFSALKKSFKFFFKKYFPKLFFRLKLLQNQRYKHETKFFRFLINPDKISIDIGANLGFVVYYMLKCTKKVVAFEPSTELVENLTRTFGKKIDIHSVALSNKSGIAEFVTPVDELGKMYALGTIEQKNTLLISNNKITEKVTIKRLDDYKFESVGFIKIDVEGHEFSVLKGAEELIRKDRPSIVCEIEDRHNSNSTTMSFSFFKEIGYSGYFFLNNKLEVIENFDPKKHQVINGPVYVNDFIFIADKEIAKNLLNHFNN